MHCSVLDTSKTSPFCPLRSFRVLVHYDGLSGVQTFPYKATPYILAMENVYIDQ